MDTTFVRCLDTHSFTRIEKGMPVADAARFWSRIMGAKVDKKTFIEILVFLSGFASMDDLYEEEVQEELWEDYKKEGEGGDE